MIEPAINTATIGRADGETTAVKFITTAIAILGSFINNLIKGRENIIGKLDFGDGYRTLCGQTNGKTNNTLFGDRGVKATLVTVFFLQITGRSKHATKLTYIFTQTNHSLIRSHGYIQPTVNSLQQIHLAGFRLVANFSHC